MINNEINRMKKNRWIWAEKVRKNLHKSGAYTEPSQKHEMETRVVFDKKKSKKITNASAEELYKGVVGKGAMREYDLVRDR